jgi:hypothetical protein
MPPSLALFGGGGVGLMPLDDHAVKYRIDVFVQQIKGSLKKNNEDNDDVE